jgi:hypothetical protein
MADLTITDADRASAEQFLTAFLSEMFPDADYSQGSVTRDHTISSISASIALMRAEAKSVRAGTSLRTVSQLGDRTDINEAVDNIVSNWFLTRRTGRPVRGTGIIIFSALHSGTVPAGSIFTRTAGRRFLLDGTSAINYLSTDLVPRYDSSGALTAYTLRVPLVAEGVGTAYEVGAGAFSNFPRFNTYVLGMENDAAFTGASDTETVEEFQARAQRAITVRDLNSERSIITVLSETFLDIDFMGVVGMGDKAMQRDRADLASPNLVHTGGVTDVYVSSAVAPRQTFTGQVGGVFTDTRPGVQLFRDDSVPDWQATNVVVGDVIYHQNAAAQDRELYRVQRVTPYFLEVSSKQTFPSMRPVDTRDGEVFSDGNITGLATMISAAAEFSALDVGRYIRITGATNAINNGDRVITAVDTVTATVTVSPANMVAEAAITFEVLEDVVIYSIGNSAPLYSQKIPTSTTGEFSRRYQEDGCVLLPYHPVYLVRDVSVLNLADGATDAVTGRVQFPNRINEEPLESAAPSDFQFRIDSRQVLEAQSARQFMVLEVGSGPQAAGVSGSLTNTNIFKASQAVFDASMVGNTKLRVTRAFHDANRGLFNITGYISPQEVTVTRVDAPLTVTVAELRVTWEVTNKKRFDGFPCRVVYDSVVGFSAIHSYVADRQNRVICADTLVRAYHPVYVGIDIRYGLKATSTGVFDEDAASKQIAAFISTFPTHEDVLHISDIVTFFQSAYPDTVGYIELPLTATYTLISPDGRLIDYRSSDAVMLKTNLQVYATPEMRLDEPALLGVTERTIRYLSDETLITLTKVT